MPAVTRLGDICTGHGCFPPRPSVSASPNVYANGIPVCRVSDDYAPHGCSKCSPHPGNLAEGSPTVFANGLPVSRIGDALNCGSSAMTGSPDVFIGNTPFGMASAAPPQVARLVDSLMSTRSLLEQASQSGDAYCEACNR